MPRRSTTLGGARSRFARKLGANIRSRRLELGLTQEQLAFTAGINAKFLQRIETGSSQPTAFNLSNLAEALSTTPSELTDRSFFVRRSRPNENQVAVMSKILERVPPEMARLAVRVVKAIAGASRASIDHPEAKR